MADKGQDLFDIMDAALKRQREGMDATLKRQASPGAGNQPTPPVAPVSEARPSGPQPAQAPAPPPAPAPIQPAPSIIRPQPPASVPSERTAVPSTRSEVPGTVSTRESGAYTERLSRVPDSALTAPAAGTLSPGEVLRGTVFASSRTTASGRTEAEPASETVVPAEPPPPQGPPRPVTVQTTASNVLRPRPASAPPPISTPISKIGTVHGNAPSGVQVAVGSSQRSTTPSGRGMFVSVEMAVLAVIGMAMSWICVFFLGMRVGKIETDLTGGAKNPRNGKIEGQPDNGDGIRETDPNRVNPLRVGNRPGAHKRPPTVVKAPSGTGKWTVEIMRYNDRAVAKIMLRKLTEKGLQGAFIGTRTVRGRKELCVCVGRFPSRNDRRAEQLKEKVINLDRRRFTGRVEVVKLD
jgi:hypothetical protein